MRGQSSEAQVTSGSSRQLFLAVHELTAAARSADVLDILRRGAQTLTGARGIAAVARAGDLCH
jgi:chemotaxis protein histidine kinase CheA